jgi:K+-transporting ATPase KdpF subunit
LVVHQGLRQSLGNEPDANWKKLNQRDTEIQRNAGTLFSLSAVLSASSGLDFDFWFSPFLCGKGAFMDYVIAGVTSLGVFIYLIYALLRPERF